MVFRKCEVKAALLVLLQVLWVPYCLGQEAVQAEILSRIDQSKKSLNQLEIRLGQENQALSRKLNALQHDIIDLRQQAKEAQRIKDEQLLSLEAIKNRVEKWEAQSAYQKHLLRAYRDSISPRWQLSIGEATSAEAMLGSVLTQVKQQLNPEWRETELISSAGEIFQAPVLSMGPVEMAFNPATNEAMFIARDFQGQPSVLAPVDPSQVEQVKNLHDNHQGHLVFDPSLGNAMKLRGEGEDVLGHVSKGGVWALPILFFGVLSVVFTLIKGYQLWRLPKFDALLFERLNSLARGGDAKGEFSESSIREVLPPKPSVQASLVEIALQNPPSIQRDELLFAILMETRHKLERFLGVVATSAAIAPLLGLLGTVSGMISTFKLMTIFGSGDASTVSGGISEALVTTELGLIVAIPSLVMSALLARRANSYNHRLETFAMKLSQLPLSSTTAVTGHAR